MDNYGVQYTIKVDSQGAINSLNTFSEKVGQITSALKPFNLVVETATAITQLKAIEEPLLKIKETAGSISVNINTSKASKQLSTLEAAISKVKKIAREAGVTLPAASNGESKTSRKQKHAQQKKMKSELPYKNMAENFKAFDVFAKQYNQILSTPKELGIKTDAANGALDGVIVKLNEIKALAKSCGSIRITTSVAPITATAAKTATAAVPVNGLAAQMGALGTRSLAYPQNFLPPNFFDSNVRYAPTAQAFPRNFPPTSITPKFDKPVPVKMGVNEYGAPANIGYRVLGPTKMSDLGGGLSFLKGMGMMYGITALGGLMGNVVKSAGEYDNIIQTTKNILKTHDKAEGFDGRFSRMEELIRNIGVQTKFTAPQVADASKFLAMAGMSISDINSAMPTIADVALVGDTDLGQTADVVTNIMTGYEVKAADISNIADSMTMTFTKTNTTLMEMAEAFKYSSSILSASQIDFETSAAAIGILGDAGIKASQAGTTLRSIIRNLTAPTKKQARAWKAIGISVKDAAGDLRPLQEIFRELRDKNLDVGIYAHLFHRTAQQGAISLANHVDKWDEVTALNQGSAGLTSVLAEEKKNTIQGLWAQITSRFTENGLQAFTELDSKIRDFLRNIIGWLDSTTAADAMSNLADATFNLIKYITELTGWVVGFINKFGGLIKLFLKFQIAAQVLLIFPKMFNAVNNLRLYLNNTLGPMGMLSGSLKKLATDANLAAAATGSAATAQKTGWRRNVQLMGNHWQQKAKGASGSIGGLVGGIAGFAIADKMGVQSPLWSMGISGAAAVAGQQLANTKAVSSAFGGLAKGVGSVVGALSSMTLGLGLLAAAAAAGFYVFLKHMAEQRRARIEVEKFNDSIGSASRSIEKFTSLNDVMIAFARNVGTANENLEFYNILKKWENDKAAKEKLSGTKVKDAEFWSFVEKNRGGANADNALDLYKKLYGKHIVGKGSGELGASNVVVGGRKFTATNDSWAWGAAAERFVSSKYVSPALDKFRSQISRLDIKDIDGIAKLIGKRDKGKLYGVDKFDEYIQKYLPSYTGEVKGDVSIKGSQSLESLFKNPLVKELIRARAKEVVFQAGKVKSMPLKSSDDLFKSLGASSSYLAFSELSKIWDDKKGKFSVKTPLESLIKIFEDKTGKKYGAADFIKGGDQGNLITESLRKFQTNEFGRLEQYNSIFSEGIGKLLADMGIIDQSLSNFQYESKFYKGKEYKKVLDFATGGVKWVDKNGVTIKDHKFAPDIDDEKYKSHYSSHSSAPKQIVLNIKNLMNNDEIYINKDTEKLVMRDFKEQLAEALSDALHNATDTLG